MVSVLVEVIPFEVLKGCLEQCNSQNEVLNGGFGEHGCENCGPVCGYLN